MTRLSLFYNRIKILGSSVVQRVIVPSHRRLSRRRGAILIEFAFSIPVFLVLIYYMHDIPKAQRYKMQMQFVAQQMVQMFQTISQGRSNKRITQRDCALIGKAAYLTIFPGNSMNPTRLEYFPLGYFIEMYIFYVVGESNNKASVKWTMLLYGTDPGLPYVYIRTDKGHDGTTLAFKTNANPSEICPELQIKPGEAKIIIEACLRYRDSAHFSDGRLCKSVSRREIFGFLFYTPSYYTNNSDYYNYYNGRVIFTPAKGLFSSTPP